MFHQLDEIATKKKGMNLKDMIWFSSLFSFLFFTFNLSLLPSLCSNLKGVIGIPGSQYTPKNGFSA